MQTEDDDYEWYDGTQCFCGQDCDCMTSIGVFEGTLMMASGVNIPSECPEVTTYSTKENGYCSGSPYVQLTIPIENAYDCWRNCSALVTHGLMSNLVAADYYDVETNDDDYIWYQGTQCFCTDACDCMDDIGVFEGTLVVPTDTTLPKVCGSGEGGDEENIGAIVGGVIGGVAGVVLIGLLILFYSNSGNKTPSVMNDQATSSEL